MSVDIDINIDAKPALALLDGLDEVRTRILPHLAKQVDKQHQIGMGDIVKNRFTGKGPFPVSQNKLGVDTGNLRRTLRFTKAKIDGDVIRVTAGSPVEYFGIHEFGFNGAVNIKAHQRRHPKTGNTHTVKSHTRNLSIPARRPLRTGLQDDDFQLRYHKAGVAAVRSLVAELKGGGQ